MVSVKTQLCLSCLFFSLLWSAGNAITCEEKQNCNECITEFDGTLCGWCTDSRERRNVRCGSAPFTECNDVYIYNVTSDINDTIKEINPESSVVPQEYVITLRPGDPLSLPINVTTVRQVPLDLYILFDLSRSTSDEVAAIRTVARTILSDLREITNQAKVGVGGFIDKPVKPFTREDLNDGGCRDFCFNFRHFGPFTDDGDELQRRFDAVRLAGNIDAPEAGLDAIGQLALCGEKVGWRDDAVKIVLYFSDDAFHFAGEGRYAGIMTPYGDICKLEGDLAANGYEEYDGLSNDYISPGHVLHLLEMSNIVPVFVAVTPTQPLPFYNVSETHETLAALFRTRGQLAVSSAILDSTDNNTDIVAQNLLETIDRQVLEILQQTRLSPEIIDGISFKITANCPPGAMKAGEGTAIESCTGVEVGNTTEFMLELTLDDCSEFGSERQTMSVAVFPLGNMIIQIDGICECDCGNNEINSSRCNFNGNFVCGECVCNDGYCGFQCQIKRDDDECPTGLGGLQCSTPFGVCRSCECICVENVTEYTNDIRITFPGVPLNTFGEACECDYFRCLDVSNSSNIESCSGRGDCCNGVCDCYENENGYKYRSRPGGDMHDCDCEPAEEVCRQSEGQEICSGRGTCGCSMCICNVPYEGEFCENINMNCENLVSEDEADKCISPVKDMDSRDRKCQICEIMERTNVPVNVSCVDVFPNKPDASTEEEEERIVEEFADKSELFSGNNYGFAAQCMYTDSDDCNHVYYILYNKDNFDEIVFVADEDEVCPRSSERGFELPIPLWVLAIVLLIALLVMGVILLIIIKLVFILLDYFEVKRLEKEVGLADFSKNQNPLYQSPDVEYKNVAYGKE